MKKNVVYLLVSTLLVSHGAFASLNSNNDEGVKRKAPASSVSNDEMGEVAKKIAAGREAHDYAKGAPNLGLFRETATSVAGKLQDINTKQLEMINKLTKEDRNEAMNAPRLEAFADFSAHINGLTDKNVIGLYSASAQDYLLMNVKSADALQMAAIEAYDRKLVDNLVSLYDTAISMNQKGWGKTAEKLGLTEESYYNFYKDAFNAVFSYAQTMPNGYLKAQFLSYLKKQITDANSKNKSTLARLQSFFTQQTGLGEGFNDSMLRKIDTQIAQLDK